MLTAMDRPLPAAGRADEGGGIAEPPPFVVDSRALLGGRREIQIWHNGAVYTLRHTRQGKLILTK